MLVLNHVRPVKIHEGLMGLNPKQHLTEGCVTARDSLLPCNTDKTKKFFLWWHPAYKAHSKHCYVQQHS